MRVVQALYWLQGGLKNAAQSDLDAMQAKLVRLLKDPKQGLPLREDLLSGLHTVPAWMQRKIRDLLVLSDKSPVMAAQS